MTYGWGGCEMWVVCIRALFLESLYWIAMYKNPSGR